MYTHIPHTTISTHLSLQPGNPQPDLWGVCAATLFNNFVDPLLLITFDQIFSLCDM